MTTARRESPTPRVVVNEQAAGDRLDAERPEQPSVDDVAVDAHRGLAGVAAEIAGKPVRDADLVEGAAAFAPRQLIRERRSGLLRRRFDRIRCESPPDDRPGKGQRAERDGAGHAQTRRHSRRCRAASEAMAIAVKPRLLRSTRTP